MTWDEPGDSFHHHTHPPASEDISLLWHTSSRSDSRFPDREDLLAQVRTLLRPDPTTFPVVSTSGDADVLNVSEQDHTDQGGLVQAITQWLQTCPNLVLILDKAEAVVIVAPKENGC